MYKRCLVVFAAGEHDDVGWRGFRSAGPEVGLFPRSGLLDEAEDVVGNSAKVALAVGRDDVEQTLAGLLGQVGLLEHAVGRVDVGQVQSGARVARVEDGRQPDAGLQGSDHDAVHFVVDDVAILPKVNRIYHLVVAVILVSVKILSLTAMARVVEKERVIWLRVLDQPVHRPKDILLGRLAHGVLLIIRQDNHVLSPVAVVLDQVSGHVAHVIDAATELTTLAKVVDAHQQRLPPARAVGVLKRVSGGCTLTKVLRGRRRRGRSIGIAMDIGV